MNTNDLPPAAKLAALIEAGRAANPDLKQGTGSLIRPEQSEACAMGFAALGAGVSRKVLHEQGYVAVADALGVSLSKAMCDSLYVGVERMNDFGASLKAICHELREGELAKVAA